MFSGAINIRYDISSKEINIDSGNLSMSSGWMYICQRKLSMYENPSSLIPAPRKLICETIINPFLRNSFSNISLGMTGVKFVRIILIRIILFAGFSG